MKSLSRIAVMVVVSLLTLTICGGGYAGKDAFVEMGIFAVLFGGLPVLGLITLFHFLDWAFGPYARYPVASIGLFPLLLIIYFQGGGDETYMKIIVLFGFAWSAAWLATSHIFSNVPPNLGAFVLAFVAMLPWAWMAIASVTGHVSAPLRPAARDEAKVFGEITGAKILRCRDHACTVLTCREHNCVETGRLVPQN